MPQPPAEHPRTSSAEMAAIDGRALALAFAGGAEALLRQADALNAINVFPVPDGDTGTNMSLTMRAAIDEIARQAGDAMPSTADVARAVAQGTLMGARGNSGVILSQILAGFVAPDASGGDEALNAAGLAAALERGRAAAYRVVSNPQEGTILTGITAAAAAARTSADGGASFEQALAAAVEAARDAAARTPDLLPVLREAGVVDAGAQGLFVLLDGMLRGLRGESAGDEKYDLGAIDASWLSATARVHGDGATSGFCTEFVIAGSALDAEAIRARLRSGGDSLLVVGGGDLVRVHVHTHQPDDALAYGRTLGAVSHEKVDDMEAQFQRVARSSAGDDAPARRTDGIAVVAVAAGDGIADLMRSLGATAIVHGGQTMNPSAGEIRQSIEAAAAASVIVLPNNKNIVLAAQQAADSLSGDVGAPTIGVIATRSIPQGIAALVAMNAEATLAENIAAMDIAREAVRTGEVTLAARETRLNGAAVPQGRPIGLIEGELALSAETVADAVLACVARMLAEREASLVTLYAGADEDEASASAVAERVRRQCGVEVEVVIGGQPHYPYVIGVE